MMEGLSPWDSLTLIVKFAAYVGMVAVIGASWVRWLQKDMQAPAVAEKMLAGYQAGGAILGLAAVLIFFLLQVGAINQQGWRGMFDATLAPVLGASSVGAGTRLRAIGFFCALVASVSLLLSAGNTTVYRIIRFLALPTLVVAALLLAFSFAVLGHVTTLSLPARISIVLHVLAIALWAGSLYPLYRLSYQPGTVAGPVLRRFGELAWGIIALLLLTGLFMLTRLLDVPAELAGSAYGRLMLLKLLLVTLLLGLGALNKFRLAARVETGGGGEPLRRAIAAELLLVAGILGVTAWLTTVVGPPGGM